jgi:hypothetical protein
MGDVFRIYLKDLTTTRAVDLNDPLALAPDSSRYWGEGTMYVLGEGLKKWYDAICNPAHEPVEDGNPVEGDSMKIPAHKKKATDPDVLIYPPSAFRSKGTMKPKVPYPKAPYTSSDFSWNPSAASVTGSAVLIYCLRTPGDSLIVKREPGMASKLGVGGTTRFNGSGTISEIYVESVLLGGGIGNMQALINVAFHETMHNKLRAGNELHTDKGLGAGQNWATDTLNETNIRRMRAALASPVIQDTQYL